MPTTAFPNLIISAANERPLQSGDWEQVTPWGEYPHPQGVQRVTREAGERMVAAFNSTSAKLGRLFRGLPIFVGHPDVYPEKYDEKRRHGGIKALEARDDGLWCKPSWNKLGNENMEEGYYVYPSAVWSFKRQAGNIIEPLELVSIGLTNDPNIPGVLPWAKNDATPIDIPALAHRAATLRHASARMRRHPAQHFYNHG